MRTLPRGFWPLLVAAIALVSRANALFRAVHLASGTHPVTFTYRPPRRFYLGAAVTALTALGLALWCKWGPRAARSANGA